MSSSTSIPTRPPPGKDPPATAPTGSDPSPPDPNTDMNPIASPITPSVNQALSTQSSASQYFAQQEIQLKNAAQQQQQQMPSRPPFSPFFTLVHDTTTSSTIHPSRIHYLFSDDDDSDLLTTACIRSLIPHTKATPHAAPNSLPDSATSASSSSSATQVGRKQSHGHSHGHVHSKSKKVGATAGPTEREERVLIIDMNDAGNTVLSATSLSADWQVVNVDVRNAPTWDGGEQTGEGGDEGRKLMLRVDGVGVGGGEEIIGGGVSEEETIALMECFDRKMGVLRKIMGGGVGLESDTTGEEGAGEAGT